VALPNISVATRPYDRTEAILQRQVELKDFELRPVNLAGVSVPQIFERVYKGEFDAGEFSLAELVFYLSRNAGDLIGIPVFLHRVFRHQYIFCNTGAKIIRPEDLSGKRIAFPRIIQTASVWIRGHLVDDYGVSAKNCRWYTIAMHHWEDEYSDEPFVPTDGSPLEQLPWDGKDENAVGYNALLEGKVDALGTTQIPPAFRNGDHRLKRLFDNYREVEIAYYKKTGIFPIMHLLVARKSSVVASPELPRQLFEMFSQAKKLANVRLNGDGSLGLAWKEHYIKEEQEIFGGDAWAYGLAKNQHTLAKFLGYCYDIGISARKMEPKELFHPSTWGLSE
jgi:4,5-dihydroxyphthalate decarboxylase